MRTRLKEVSGIDWFDGAVMNCRWSGPLLCDVLRSVGVASDSSVPDGSSSDDRPRPRSDLDPDPVSYINPGNKAHVAFASYQTVCQDDSYYGSSIPLARCMRPSAEIVLALDMNGSPLTAERGFPLRVVAPGIAGARGVKWLDRISVQAGESPNFYQQRDYKILPPEATDAAAAEGWWGRVPAIQDMPVNSVVAIPGRGETVVRRRRRKMKSKGRMKVDDVDEKKEEEGEEEGWGVGDEYEGKVYVKGYALPAGEDGPVVRVEVSGDGGLMWTDARLIAPFSSSYSSPSSSSSSSSPGGKKQNQDPNDDEQQKHHTSKWAWTLWEAYVWMEPGQGRKILSRATDTAGNTQPACPQWNFRGVAYNGYGEVDELTVV